MTSPTGGSTAADASPRKRAPGGLLNRFLNVIEWSGNKLPDDHHLRGPLRPDPDGVCRGRAERVERGPSGHG